MSELDHRILLMVLLGGEAGLRSGEIRALEWSSIDFRRHVLTVERSDYKGHVTLPKHDKIRTAPMAKRLTQALLAHGICKDRVLYCDGMADFSPQPLRDWLKAACRKAGLSFRSPYCLRHTLYSNNRRQRASSPIAGLETPWRRCEVRRRRSGIGE